jgi:hypothetical protein
MKDDVGQNPRAKLVRFKVAKVILGELSDEALDKLCNTGAVDLVRFGKSKYITTESIDRLIDRGGVVY